MESAMTDQPAPDTDQPRLLDEVGIAIAGLCAVHCLATIVLVSGLGIGGHFLLAPQIHEYGLTAAAAIAAVAIGWGALRHWRREPVILASSGLALMLAALLGPHGVVELVLTFGGVVLVAIGHFLNMRRPRTA
jgi:hypothetical protein